MLKLSSIVVLAIAIQRITAVPVWGQCGGRGYSGDTACDAGNTCVLQNEWHSQCRPGTAQPTTPPVDPTTLPPPTTTPPTTTPPTTTPVDTTTPPPPTTTPPTTTPPTTTVPLPTGTGLHAKFVGKGKKFWGSCADAGLLNKAANAAVLKSDFGQVTPENSMKWDALQPNRGSFNWGNADTLVNWAVSNGKLIRGHTLVWHSQLPNWVASINDKGTLDSVMKAHIDAVAGRYKGKLYAWDVVNECLNEDGSLRSSVFSRLMGESFVALAFQYARAADPTAKLYINDYNLDSNNAKTQGIVRLTKRVNQNSKLIDGVGTQMHLEAGGTGGVLAALTALASAGDVEVAITELDIKNASPNDYTTVTRACLQVSACVAITSWGVSDVDSWRSGNSPLLFDGNYRPKPAYTAIIQALN